VLAGVVDQVREKGGEHRRGCQSGESLEESRCRVQDRTGPRDASSWTGERPRGWLVLAGVVDQVREKGGELRRGCQSGESLEESRCRVQDRTGPRDASSQSLRVKEVSS
jgi:hypothetical protein